MLGSVVNAGAIIVGGLLIVAIGINMLGMAKIRWVTCCLPSACLWSITSCPGDWHERQLEFPFPWPSVQNFC
jgi:uncharacterized membrane protein YqgA involved in biofilm formation